MRQIPLMIAASLWLIFGAAGQEKEVKPGTVVAWMRSVNTREAEFRMANHRFATADELGEFMKSEKNAQDAVFVANAISPYTLQITTTGDGSHYIATIKWTSNMNDKATWCRTAAFSDESAVIYLGQSIGCLGADSLGVSSEPSR